MVEDPDEVKPILGEHRLRMVAVNATDPDCGVNGQIHYSLAGLSSFFTIEEFTGRICISQQLDFESHELFEFSVIATDSGGFSTTANVQMNILDVNDNVPEFYPRNYSKNIQDSTQPGSEVITVQATDPDSGTYGHILYSIFSGNGENRFTIDAKTGTISVHQSLPSTEQLYRLVVDARDGGGLGSAQRAQVYISVTGQGYNPPVFLESMYRFQIAEDVGENFEIGTVVATYAGSSKGISYSISSGDRYSFFKIQASTGVISTVKELDHDEFPSFLLSVQAETGSTHLFGTTQVNITVLDVNDNAPQFISSQVTTSVSEATSSMVTIYSAHATDKDSRESGNGEVRYRLQEARNLFEIDAMSGDIHLAIGASLDYETVRQHSVVIVAFDQAKTAKLSSSMTLIVNVQDANDNPPVFERGHFVFHVLENESVNKKVYKINATDKDSGENGRISFSLVNSDGLDKFGIFPSDGFMYLKQTVDREERSEYTFTVVARDHGQPSKSASAQVTVYIEDFNDNVPEFTQEEYRFFVEENLASGKVVGHVMAHDADSLQNSQLQYDFTKVQNDFQISSQGVISTTRALDRETKQSYDLEVVVRDSGTPVRYSKVGVYISVTDVNDHAPEITNSPLKAYIDENQSKGERVVKIRAEDRDAGNNGTISFSLDTINDPLFKDALNFFEIHPESGWITTKEVLDYEVKNLYKFKVIATDSGVPTQSTSRDFEILVNDFNDGAPVFPDNVNITFYVVENTPIGTFVGKVLAYDSDAGEYGQISYYITAGNIFGLFSVSKDNGSIYTIREIDFEKTSSQTVGITAVDNSVYQKSSVITIKINIVDTNDNSPVFEHDPVFLVLRENTPINTVIHTFTATDADSGVNGTVRYEIVNENSRHLQINPYTGKLSVNRTIDYEQMKDISLIIRATDQAPTPASQRYTTLTVRIQVLDENDNAPMFQSYSMLQVHEDEPVGYQLVSIIATDADGNYNNSGNNLVTFSILSGNSQNAFNIDQHTGVLSVASPLDRETVSTYALEVEASDHGHPRQATVFTLTIQVLDVNDNPPNFLKTTYEASVEENSIAGKLIVKVSATDADTGINGQLMYMISEGIADDYFDIDRVTGLITLATDKIDRETKSSYTFTVYVQDAGSPRLFDMATVVVNVTDVNDNMPVFRVKEHFLQIPENLVQDNIYLIVAQDADIGDNARVRYSITGGNIGNKFVIDSDTGELSLQGALDRELVRDYTLNVKASDGYGQDTCEMFIRVQDQNDNDPIFQKTPYEKVLAENVPVGTTVVVVTAADPDEGANGNVTYSLNNESEDASVFDINPVTGVIVTKGTFDREKKAQYSFEVVASDAGIYDRRSEKVRVEVQFSDINDNAPVFKELPYTIDVTQGTNANTVILTMIAEDKDAGKNGEVTYRLLTNTNFFVIDGRTGEIRTAQRLSVEALGYHNLKVIATDGGDTPQSATGVVEVSVGSVNSQLQFTQTNYTGSVQEHSPKGTSVISVTLSTTPAIPTIFSFATGNNNNAFSIDNQGRIKVNNPAAIDYEESESMRLIVAAMSGEVYAYTTVWVNLEDVNDNAPLFSQNRYVTKFYEEQKEPDTFVMQVMATDADSDGPNSDIVYNIVGIYSNRGESVDGVFVIDPPKTGIIKTNVIVDYEVIPSYKLIIEAKDNGIDGSKSSSCTVRINIIDINDNPPKFPNTSPVEISENADIGTSVAMVTANDVDTSPAVVYNFSNQGNPDGMFSLDRYSGIIRLARNLDYETRRRYIVGLQATDGNHTVQTTQEVLVLDENDHAPQFVQQSYKVTLQETEKSAMFVVRVNATDADSGQNAVITYSLATDSNLFYINRTSGMIYTNGAIQYDPEDEIVQLVVMATDGGSPHLSAVAAVYVQVTSVNKFEPKFNELRYSAQDNDTHGHNKDIDYFILAGNTDNTFIIDQKNGSIILNSPLDRETVDQYHLVIMAKDRGNPPKNSTTIADIIVQDVNDMVPYFEYSEYFVELNESFPSDTKFLSIKTFDDDEGDHAKVYYTITSGNEDGLFIFNPSTGDLYITPNLHLDYERQSYHILVVKITDCNGCGSGVPVFSNITLVHVNVTDVNEYSPTFPVMIYYEGVSENMQAGSVVFEAHANDKDAGEYGLVTYTLTGTDLFSVHYKTGLVTNNQEFDYESLKQEQLEYIFQIHAEDKGGRRSSINVKLRVLDEDEYSPVFVSKAYTFDIPGSAPKGTFIGRVLATDEDKGSAGRLVYKMKPSHNYFTVNASTGELYVIHDLNKQISSEATRSKREVNAILIEVSSGMADSLTASVVIDIEVERSCQGCAMQYLATPGPSTAPASVNVVYIIVPILCVIIIAIIIVVFVFVRRKRSGKTPPPSETPMYDTDEFDSPQPQTMGPPPNYTSVTGYHGNPMANITVSSDMSGHSGSSGRGSAEDDEDEELAMINSSSPSCLNNSNGFRKNMPDSGIQEDDNTSEPSVQNHQDYLARLGIDTAKINSKAKSGLGQSVESMHQFSDSGGGEGDGLEIGNIDYSKLNGTNLDHDGLMDKNNDMGFHEPEPNMGGSLSNVINSEEEYSGSYNWDYLLDWGPQYQPLASVFSEIARLKDDSYQPKKQAVQIVPQHRHVNASVPQPIRMNSHPPPMITNAPPKAQPVSRSARSSHSSGVSNVNSARSSTINTSLPSMPRSPISHESSFTSPALTPSFTPSLSPLATRSPSVSPVNSGRGQVTPRSRAAQNNQFVFSSSSSEQELRI
ncbi:DS-like protein [Mya arenaria]|uniref:DS-like protein n=1 Tax=Mya arenaria TaxID=6604 RepID=A0ABY7DW23_MYAAR|nr:DS-like protein [Mya arenaria]